MSVAAIILAAGSSTRLGHPKQNARLGAETLLERTVRVARSAALEPIFVVAAPGNQMSFGQGISLLVNEAAIEGMASSVRTGIAAASSIEVMGAIILACDQPAVTADHLRKLGGGDEIVASGYAGRTGVPAYFPRSTFPELMRLSGDVGAREMLRHARTVELKQGELDIDTAEDLKRARELYSSEPPL